MTQVIGEQVLQAERHDALKLPRSVKKRPPFLYKSHPLRFSFYAKTGEWLPDLAKMWIDPGVDGVADSGDITIALAGNTSRGWQIIQPSDERLGEFKNYSQKLPHISGGHSHIPIFMGIDVEAGRAFITPDTDRWVAFRRHLIASGIVPPCSENIRNLKTREQRALCERLEGRQSNSPNNAALARRSAKARALLDAMEGKTKTKAKRATKKAEAAADVT